MKTRILNYTLLSLVAFASLTVSCSDGDTTKPVVDLTEPKENATYVVGAEEGILLEADLEDNDKLGSYSVNIHNNFDGHDHGHSRHAGEESTVNFSYDKSLDLSGEKTVHISHREIKVPANATPGKYHFVVRCFDAEGNETMVFRNIELIAPVEE